MTISRRAITLILVIIVLLGVFFIVLSGRMFKNKVDNTPEPASSKTLVRNVSAVDINNIKQTKVSATEATITWSTLTPSTSVVAYGTAASVDGVYPSKIVEGTTPLKAHSITISGLSANTKIYYRIISTDNKGNTTTSDEHSFSTMSAAKTTTTTPPPPRKTTSSSTTATAKVFTVSGIKATSISSTSTQISWTTTAPATSQVFYGTESIPDGLAYSSQSVKSTALVTKHSVTLSGLTPNAKIYYKVVSIDGSGKNSTSKESSFTVATVTISSLKATVAALPSGNPSVVITWTTNVPATSQVIYDTESSPSGSYDLETPVDTTLTTTHKVTLVDLEGNAKTYYRAVSTDSSGTKGISVTEASFSTPNIYEVTSSSITTKKATIKWRTLAEATSKVQYGTISGTYQFTTTEDTSMTKSHTEVIDLSGILAGTKTVYYKVISKDVANKTDTSPEYSFSL